MGFSQSLSGLNAASKTLETIGNNVANANTVGFKQSKVKFADVYAAASGGAAQVGIGTKIAAVSQQFQAGNITASNNPLDIAISGNGFFPVDDNGVTKYTRNGQFEMDKDAYIVTSSGARLLGYLANGQGDIQAGEPTALRLNTADIMPAQTEEYKVALKLNAAADIKTDADFDPTDPTTYNSTTSTTVYDSLGGSHVLQTYYVKTAANTWSVFAADDGVLVPAAPTTGKIGELLFQTNGALDPATVLPFTAQIDAAGAVTPFDVEVDFANSTQYEQTFGVISQSQDGYSSGRLLNFAVGADGIINGRYSNGQTVALGQVLLANFVNPNGLSPDGNNMWTATPESGTREIGEPRSGSLGALQSLAVEESNVDMTAELVNMITAQQYYQANAQSIKAQDQVMQTLLNLR